MKFTQHIVFNAASEDALVALMREWQDDDSATAPGYLGGRVLRFRDKPGKFVIQADFESWEAAEQNTVRPETQQWAARMLAIVDGEPKYENLDVVAEF